jgi:hypothetical protein
MYEITKLDPTHIEDEPVITTTTVYSKNVDMAVSGSDDIIYKGYAVPGTATSAPAWRISKLTINSQGDVVTQWADGNSNFDNVWDNRGSLSYV